MTPVTKHEMKHLIAINGSYRPGGTMDQAIEVAAQAALASGATVEIVHLRDHPIAFCLNCMACAQQPGETPGQCVQHDDMQALIDKIEAADAFILASPTNVYSVTVLFKRFMERLTVYAYWPEGTPAPVYRKKAARKKALLIASGAAPGWIGRLFFSTLRQLKLTAKIIGARSVGTLFIGQTPPHMNPVLSNSMNQQIQQRVARLM